MNRSLNSKKTYKRYKTKGKAMGKTRRRSKYKAKRLVQLRQLNPYLTAPHRGRAGHIHSWIDGPMINHTKIF